MTLTEYYDNCESLHDEDYEDEVSMRDIDPEDLTEWTHSGDLSKIDLKTEVNLSDVIQDIFSTDFQDYMPSEECTPGAHAISPTPPIDSLPDLNNPWVQEFVLYMSKLSISMQRSELSREAIRKHRGLMLCQRQQPEGPTVQCSVPILHGDVSELAKIDSLRAQFIESMSRMNKKT